MKILGINGNIAQSAEDIVSGSSNVTEPTQARIHAIVSASAEDDSDGILQVETATIAGTIGAGGAGNATITVTSALVQGSPLAVSVAVANNDTASIVAGKVRTQLNATAAVTTHYTVGGTGAEVSLTAKVAAANDSTLNIASTNGTCTGLTPAATSANTTAGVVGSGAHRVRITGINSAGNTMVENVDLQGVTPVNTVNSYKFINQMEVITAGTGGKNAGAITATAATDSTVTCRIETGYNKSMQAMFMSPRRATVNGIYASALNATGGAITKFTVLVKEAGGVFLPVFVFELNSDKPTYEGTFSTIITYNTLFKVQAIASAGTSSCVCNFDAN